MELKKINKSIHIVKLLSVGAILFVIARLVYIQVEEGEKWRAKGQKQILRDEVVAATRGNIYSADGSLLATSIPKYDIAFDPSASKEELFQKEIKKLADSLARFKGKKTSKEYENQFRRMRSNGGRYVFLFKKLSYPEYQRLKTFPLLEHGANKGGLIVTQMPVREHPMGMIANRTIGYERINEDGTITRKGIEAAFTEYLSGKDGKRKVQRVTKSTWKPIHDENFVDPQEGLDIVTTIDVYIQDIAHHALLNSLEYYGAEHGTVVVMEAKTGEIKAISNLGLGKNGKYTETINYAVIERQDPGSTFKLASYLALIDNGKVDTATIFDTRQGLVVFGGKKVRDSNRRGYGQISFAKGFEVSSNTVITQAVYQAYKDKPEEFIDKLETFGFNKTLGLDLKGEPPSYIPRPGDKAWSKIALPWMAYGYGISITPLQTLAFYNAVANGGEMVKPRFVKEIKKVNKTVKTFDKEVLNPQIASKESIKKAQEMLKNVVKRGTGKGLYSSDFSMAGKTGTAQMNYGSGKKEMFYASSFVGFFPAENPKYSCIVVIHRPTQHSYYGGDVAGPVFKRIAQKIFTDVPSLKEIKEIDKPLNQAKRNYQTYYTKVRKMNGIVPNVIGMQAMDALPLLENLGVKTQVIGKGRVKSQSLSEGHQIKKGDQIVLILG